MNRQLFSLPYSELSAVALCGKMSHLQMRAPAYASHREHGAAGCFVIILFHCILYFVSLHLMFSIAHHLSLITHHKCVSISLIPVPYHQRPPVVSETSSSSAPSAWALSMRDDALGQLVGGWLASSSFTARTLARFCLARLACMGPMPDSQSAEMGRGSSICPSSFWMA